MEATYGEKEVTALLQKVRIFNRAIGLYEMFVVTDNFDYSIKLSNGRISLKIEELQDDEQDNLTPEQLTTIANRFVISTSQITVSSQTEPTEREKPVKKKKSIGKPILSLTIIFLIVLGAFAILTYIKDSNSSDSGSSYQEKIMSVEEIERAQPTNFLSASATHKPNFWDNKININCIITNRATVATYKDAVLRITYFTKTNTALGSNDYTSYEVFSPHSAKTIKLKVDKFDNVASVVVDIVSATAY